MRIGRLPPCQQTRYLQHTNGIREAKIITHASEEIILASPGTRCSLKVHRFGSAGARPKAYLYAALQRRQVAGTIDAQSPERDAGGVQRKRNISGEIVLQPLANPDGTTQQLNGCLAGRNGFDGSGNFKRNWLDLTVTVVKHLDKHAW